MHRAKHVTTRRYGKLSLIIALIMVFGVMAAVPAAADEKSSVDIYTNFSAGTFTVDGGGVFGSMCPSGTFGGDASARLLWIADDTFIIWADHVFMCEGSDRTFVLELKNTIVILEGGIPGRGTWKLKDSTGFDSPPRGHGQILWGDPGETYHGFVK